MNELQQMISHLCPEGVEFKKLGEIAKCYSGATPQTNVPAYWENGTIPWMNSGEVNLGRVFKTEKNITQKGYDSCSTKMVPPPVFAIGTPKISDTPLDEVAQCLLFITHPQYHPLG